MTRQQFENEIIRIAKNLIENITDDQLLMGDALTADAIRDAMISEECWETNTGVWNSETRGGLCLAIEDSYWDRLERFYAKYPEERPQESMDVFVRQTLARVRA